MPESTGRVAARPRLPQWLKVPAPGSPRYMELKQTMQGSGLHTVCEEAHCPNIGECWGNGTATFMILGDICTRRCHYCAVTTGRPAGIDLQEPCVIPFRRKSMICGCTCTVTSGDGSVR